jgi:uracil-DNA glycosylase
MSLWDSLSLDWASVLQPSHEAFSRVEAFLDEEEAAGQVTLPPRQDLLRAFDLPPDRVKVLVLGQDPYPTPGHANGLAFSVSPDVSGLPRSLRNIFTEYCADTGHSEPLNGDLSRWSEQGVLLLNRVLSVRSGQSGSHRNQGWEEITAMVVEGLAARPTPMVSILWGQEAARVKPLLARLPWIESAHPSPLSASRGFFGSRPFTRANAALIEHGLEPIDWRLPTGSTDQGR